MAVKHVQIALDDAQQEALDAEAQRRGTTRSGALVALVDELVTIPRARKNAQKGK